MPKTQCEKIYDFMMNHGSITARQAYHMGIMRLASRISDMKSAGIPIKSETVKVKNRDGSIAYVSKYSFIKKEEVS